jgi:hypothetical protein
MAPKIIEFDVVFNNANQEEGIEIPLALNANGRSLMTVSFVDTGCGACLFGNEIGVDLGIDIESGEFAIFKSGAGGSVPAYGHPVVIEFLASDSSRRIFYLGLAERSCFDATKLFPN